LGKVTFGLFGENAPLTCENFRSITQGIRSSHITGKPLTYKGSPVSKLYPQLYMYAGQIENHSCSIYPGGYFQEKGGSLRHSRPYLLSMQPIYNTECTGSYFRVTFAPNPRLDE